MDKEALLKCTMAFFKWNFWTNGWLQEFYLDKNMRLLQKIIMKSDCPALVKKRHNNEKVILSKCAWFILVISGENHAYRVKQTTLKCT